MPEIKMKSSTFVLLLVVVSVLVLVLNTTFRFLPFQKYNELDEVASLISSNYIDKIDKETLIRNGVSGMVSDLDPYSDYLGKKELSGLLEESKGEFQGVGMEIAIRNGYPTVVSPIEGSPAYQAGIKTGDKIIKIDGVSTKDLNGDQAQQKIRGPKGTKVRLTIFREGVKDTLEFRIKRGVVEIRSVAFAEEIQDGIGYVRLTRFSENSPVELKEALRGLKNKEIKGLILDLRGNPGGLLQEAVGVAELFLKKGELIVEIRGRKSSDSKKFYSQGKPVFEELPLVLLVDFGSASASEILAGAIQDQDRGLILGDTTFGKGAVQSLFELKGDAALKLTTAKYFIPSGRSIQKERRKIDELLSMDTTSSGAQHIVPPPKERQEYHTKNGRKVYGGGGIVPDVIIPDPVLPPLVQQLLQGQHFFDFAVDYAATQKNITENFQADEKVLQEFRDFVQSKGFEYQASSESELQKLKETIEKEKGLSSSVESEARVREVLDRLDFLLRERKNAEFQKDKDFLKWQIEEAVLTNKFGSSERYKVWARYTEQIKKAIEILKDRREYESLLSK